MDLARAVHARGKTVFIVTHSDLFICIAHAVFMH